MTLEDIKHGIEQSSTEDRMFLAAYLKHLTRKDDPAYRAELSRLRDEMKSGKKMSLDQVKRLHDSLEAEGL